jgi:hypothetical protein
MALIAATMMTAAAVATVNSGDGCGSLAEEGRGQQPQGCVTHNIIRFYIIRVILKVKEIV